MTMTFYLSDSLTEMEILIASFGSTRLNNEYLLFYDSPNGDLIKIKSLTHLEKLEEQETDYDNYDDIDDEWADIDDKDWDALNLQDSHINTLKK